MHKQYIESLRFKNIESKTKAKAFHGKQTVRTTTVISNQILEQAHPVLVI